MPVLDTQALIANRVQAIRDFHREVSLQKAEIDVSGGVDSAVVLCLLARALGSENVIAVFSGINSSQRAAERAREVAWAVQVPLVELNLTEIFRNLCTEIVSACQTAKYDVQLLTPPPEMEPTPGGHWRLKKEAAVGVRRNGLDLPPVVLGSMRSTLRAPVGRAVNRILGGGIRHGTGNECEDRWLRFYQKGGDGEVDTNPIAMLSKGEVYQLARALEVPLSILDARPSPDLWAVGDNHSDEDEISAYLGVTPPEGQAWYSYVDQDGAYRNVGWIERISRLADICGNSLFDDRRTEAAEYLSSSSLTDNFGIPARARQELLEAAREAERATRHKVNPNIPTLGTRRHLLDAKILTNRLPTGVWS